MRWRIISAAMLLACSLPMQAMTVSAVTDSLPDSTRTVAATDSLQPEKAGRQQDYYDRHTRRYQSLWQKLIPRQSVMQFAGSIGLMSWGLGWHYGHRDSWETEILVGFVPKYHSDCAKATFTLKERFVPWHLRVSSRWTVEPLTTGLFFNTIFGEDFWANQPSRYPKKYYGFSTKVRTHVFIGQRFCYRIPSRHRIWNKSASFYYELSTCDLYVASAATNRNVRLGDILSLSFGVRMEIF